MRMKPVKSADKNWNMCEGMQTGYHVLMHFCMKMKMRDNNMKYIIMEVTDETFSEELLDNEESVRGYFYVSKQTFDEAEEEE